MKKVYINGYFTKEHINGVPRYAMEIVKRLDQYFKPGEAELVIPPNATNIPNLVNINICKWEDRGKKREINGLLWGNISYALYVRRKQGVNVNFSNRAEWIKGSITALHDIISLENNKYDFIKDNLNVKLKRAINRIWFLSKIFIKKCTAETLVTVSEYSKQDICSRIGFDTEKVSVIGNGWEHVISIEERNEQLDTRIVAKQFYFFIGNINPHKNIKWIIEEAQMMPNEYFVIAGKIPKEITEEVKVTRSNIIFLGYISDAYMKYLMINCKALLFPSYVEGFGIPPLEELALGGKVIVSDIPVMHEIYGDSVYYINPNKGNVDLNRLIINPVESAEKVLDAHNWDMSARKWFKLIDDARKREK